MLKIITFFKSFFTKTETEFTKLTNLPVGVTEFHQWADSIIAESHLPDPDTLKLAICQMVVRLEHTASEIPKIFFVNALRKAAANQIAFAVSEEIKIKQVASKAAKAAEAVVAPTTSGGQS